MALPARLPPLQAHYYWRVHTAKTHAGQKHQFALLAMPSCHRLVIGSEVRLVCPRNSAVPCNVDSTQILGADPFWPEGQATPISNHGRPGHCENAFVLDCKMELEPLALIIGINDQARKTSVLPQTPYLAFSRGFVLDQPIAFDDVESASLDFHAL